MDIQERIELAKSDLVSALLKYNVSYGKASGYANTYAQEFVETGAWTKESLDDLKNIGINYGESNRHTSSYDHSIFREIGEVISQYVLTFAERARLEFEKDQAELTPEETNQRKEDILALEEMETLCNGKKECSVTDEQKELIYTLVTKRAPEKFEKVTKIEIELFTFLGKKFGLSDELIEDAITKMSYYGNQKEKMNKSLKAIDSINNNGSFTTTRFIRSQKV